MLHSFVVARLLPRVPAWATYGQRVAPSLVTKPFLALHLHPNAVEDFVYRKPDLFVVSRKKPSLPGSEYFILNSNSTGIANSLTVVPPLPFKEPLYLSVTPRITATFPNTKEYERLLKAEKYQLDETSVNKFQKALKEAGPSIPAIVYTGGDDEPGCKWDTWSAESAKEENGSFTFGRYLEFFFDLLPFDKLPNDFETSVFDETLLLRQLTLDYTWEGCRLITRYIEQLRKLFQDKPRIVAMGTTFRPPTLLWGQYRAPNPLVDSQRACTAQLQSLPIVHDGDPNYVKEDQLADDLRDDVPILELHVAERVPAVIANDVKIILFDCNSLIDRDGPLQDALTRIFPPSEHLFSAQQLLILYVEYETLRVADGLPESPIAVVQKIARYMGVSLEDSSAENILERYAKPRLAQGVQDLITSLVEHGYTPVGIPSTAPVDLVSQIQGLSLDLFAIAAQHPPLTLDTIISFCKKSNPTIRLDQIVVVTPDLYYIGESASRAGLPIVHLALMNTRSYTLSIPTIIPTYTLRYFDELLSMLRDPASVPAPKEPPKTTTPPFRIHDSYQCTFLLGAGSFAWVWNGIQVHTGAGVAIKFELIGHPSDPETLPYETAIYEQLEGIQGIPRVHWSGKDMNANVLVMDKLGPNLEQLRRFCRGRLGLKTVLMLGEQMLSTIEHVHGRGVIVRDIKPENFALGLLEEYQQLFMFDMGLSKLYLDPSTGTHIPFREGRAGIGTPRYASHNVHFGLEPSRRDDVEAIGNLLLYLLHGRLPWQGIVAPSIIAKLRRMGEMKRGKPFADFLTQSPPFFTLFFEHCRSLQFEDKPDYAYLRGLLRGAMKEDGWEYDWEYDWWKPGDRGTVLPEEYKLDMRFVEPPRYEHDAI